MTNIIYLNRGGKTIRKGHGVASSFGDGSSYVLEGEHHAPDGHEWNPFFYDPRTGRSRDDLSLDYFGRKVNHLFPKEAVAHKMAQQLIQAGRVRPEDAEMHVKHDIMNESVRRKNAHMIRMGRPDQVAPIPWDDNMQLHDDYKHMTVAPSYQAKNLQTHERDVMTNYNGRKVPFNYFPGVNKATGQSHVESATQHEWREGLQVLDELGHREHTSCYNKSHIEPGTMTGHNVYRHQTAPDGGSTVPGGHTPRGAQERYNETRELPPADPANILFDKNGSPKLPPAFWLKGGTNKEKNVGPVLEEQYGVQDPQLRDAMAGSAVGQLLCGTGKRSGSRLDTLMKKLADELDIEGENAEAYKIIHSNTPHSTTWTGRGSKAGRNLAAMIRLADHLQIDLSNFAGVSADQVSAGPRIMREWQRVAPQVGQNRGGAAEGHDWDAPMPERAHASAQLPQQVQAISDGPTRHAVIPREPIGRAPPSPAPAATSGFRPLDLPERQPVQSRFQNIELPEREQYDPAVRILRAMESMQLSMARQDDAVLKHLPTKRDLNIQNAQDVGLMASRLGVTVGDIHGLYASGGDWEAVAKQFRVAPALVGAVKVAFT